MALRGFQTDAPQMLRALIFEPRYAAACAVETYRQRAPAVLPPPSQHPVPAKDASLVRLLQRLLGDSFQPVPMAPPSMR